MRTFVAAGAPADPAAPGLAAGDESEHAASHAHAHAASERETIFTGETRRFGACMRPRIAVPRDSTARIMPPTHATA
jgi:hypothetical protein